MSRPKPSGRSEAEIRRLMQEAATRALEAEDEIYYHYGKEPTPFAENAALQALLNAGYTQTAGKLPPAGRREAGKAAWAARSNSKRSYHDVFNGVIVPTSESVQNIPFAKLSGMTDAQTLALQKAHHAVLQLVL